MQSLNQNTVGLVGCGLWGRLIVRELQALGAGVIVVDADAGAREWAAANGAKEVLDSSEDLPGVDAIIVATPAVTHAAIIASLLARQVPILVEKPFTTDVPSAERLATEGEGLLFVGHVWRYHPGIELLGAIARSGELGPVLGLRSVRANWTSPRTDVDSVWNLAPHDLTLAIEILGGIPVPKAANAEMHEGRAVGLTALLGGAPWQEFTVSNRYADKRREVRLHCRDGVAVLADPDQGFVEIIRGDGRSAKPVIERQPYSSETALRRELAAFLGYVAGGPRPKSDGREGLAVVRAIVELRGLAGLSET